MTVSARSTGSPGSVAGRTTGRRLDLIDHLTPIAAPTETLELSRIWPRNARHALLEYRRPSGGLVPAQWFGLDAGGADLDRLREIAAETPGARLIEQPGILLHEGGVDRRLGPLATLAAREECRVIAHRPERRAVVLHSLDGNQTYLKLTRPRVTHELARRGRLLASATDALRAPQLLETDGEIGLTTWGALEGQSFLELLATSEGAQAAAAVGAALRSFHETAPPAWLDHHCAAAEKDVLRRWNEHVSRFAPAHHARIAAVSSAVDASLDALEQVRGLIHRDLHDKQLLWNAETGVSLLDPDTVAAGDPALDVANLLVQLELRVLQRRITAAQCTSLSDSFASGYRIEAGMRSRLRAYADGARLRLACVYAFRPTWRHRAPRLLERIGMPLGRL